MTQLPLKCIATCSPDVIIKGTKMLKDAINSTKEDLVMGKDDILAKHCTPLRVEDRKLFEEGNLCNLATSIITLKLLRHGVHILRQAC